MRIFHNHSLSSIYNVVDLVKAEHKDVWMSVSNDRWYHPVQDHADCFFSETKIEDNQAYFDWVVSVLDEQEIDVFIPGRRASFFAGRRKFFEQKGVRLVTASDEATMDMIEDKPRFLRHVENMGLPITPFTLFKTAEEYKGSPLHKDGVQLSIKPAIGIYGSGFRKIVKTAGVRDLLGDSVYNMAEKTLVELLSEGEFEKPMMLMPYLDGIERSTDIACLDGRVLGAVSRAKGVSHQVLSHHDQLLSFAKDLVKEFSLSGLINLQTIEDKGGVPCILEINTRASGGIGQTAKSGVNLPALLVSALKGETMKDVAVPVRDVLVTSSEKYHGYDL